MYLISSLSYQSRAGSCFKLISLDDTEAPPRSWAPRVPESFVAPGSGSLGPQQPNNPYFFNKYILTTGKITKNDQLLQLGWSLCLENLSVYLIDIRHN